MTELFFFKKDWSGALDDCHKDINQTIFFRFCPTGILECQCGPAACHMSICSNPDIGHIYLATSCDRMSSTDYHEEKMFDPK